MSGTKIFARALPDGRQLLAYAMKVQLEQELAMILPLPVLPAAGAAAVSFLDLGDEETFFTELEAAFPVMLGAAAQFLSRGGPVERAPLPVFEVGRYVASFVPTPRDFSRLDPRFALPSRLLSRLPVYADYGFAVFQLKPLSRGARKPQQVQPMALAFTPREARALFFPTVHVHDGSAPAEADFDHTLYCQADGVLEATLGWTPANSALGEHVQGPLSRALVDVERPGFAHQLWGALPNQDTWLREPVGVTVDDLRGAGAEYVYAVRATAAHALAWEGTERAPWADTARARLPALCRGLREGLAQLVDARRSAWHLAPLEPRLPPHFMNGPQLWTGTTYLDGKPATGHAPGLVRFTPFSKRVEPQAVTFGFSRLPSQDEARAINATLNELLERALA